MSAASPPVVRPRKMSSKYGEYRRSSLSPAQPEREQPQQLKPQDVLGDAGTTTLYFGGDTSTRRRFPR